MRWTVQRDRAPLDSLPKLPHPAALGTPKAKGFSMHRRRSRAGNAESATPLRSPISSFLLHFPPSHCQFVACSLSLSLLRPWRFLPERMHVKTPSRLLPERGSHPG